MVFSCCIPTSDFETASELIRRHDDATMARAQEAQAIVWDRERSAPDGLHGGGWVALARGHALRRDRVDVRHVVGGELHLERGHVLLEILAALGAGDRDDVVAARVHPG